MKRRMNSRARKLLPNPAIARNVGSWRTGRAANWGGAPESPQSRLAPSLARRRSRGLTGIRPCRRSPQGMRNVARTEKIVPPAPRSMDVGERGIIRCRGRRPPPPWREEEGREIPPRMPRSGVAQRASNSSKDPARLPHQDHVDLSRQSGNMNSWEILARSGLRRTEIMLRAEWA